MKKNQSRIMLKRIFLPVVYFFLCFSLSQVSAQTDDENEKEETPAPKVKYKLKRNLFNYNNIISVYPFQSVINYMTVAYELKTGEKSAFKTIAGYAKKESSLLGLGTISDYSGYRLEMQFKYFMKKKGSVFNGIYIAPFVLFKSCNYTFDGEETVYDPITGSYNYLFVHVKDKASVVHVGFILGYQLKLGDSFTLDMFAGEGVMSAYGNYKYASRIFDAYSNEIRMKLGLSIGYGF